MDFEILGWESKGLRCPNGKVDLCVNGSKKINLIQMPSGTGKTTYLELIRGALSGSILTLHTNINQFRDDINVSNEGYFKLSTKCKDEAIDFELNFNFKKNTVEYMTSSPLTGGSMKG